MKKFVVATTALLLFSAAPAFAMSCCGGKGKGAMMCGKGGMAMNHSGKDKKAACCCEGMGSNMSKRG
ncbi:hypothetical protein [Methylobacterium haplocladii]|uniref:Lipoprotein n=1 Tax=Methylobacterium haplocladii TaxID=1176176 RepID=A0A512IQD5_9HYPH|nr:hypothetical protein [Methylobacterium haplocladii]GEO99934.1 hypothetical protein MHA02_23220 [Methylobacterium haplocladii]GJD85217.1 hypothetical protein HPGCJGGD_3103 [Methylobacterium haplocladii]GLS59648.1 hypothetical protein GCM10007887_23170 [Methylobacterium haplocladii]